MAVLQAARSRSVALPASTRTATAARPRTSATTALRSTHGVHPVGLLLAGILVATMLALAYLTQTLGSNATSSQIEVLQAESEVLEGTLMKQSIRVAELIEVDVIKSGARAQGFRSLGEPTVLRAP